MSRPRSPLTEQILRGGRPELARLAAEGLVPLPLEELIELQVALALESDDPVIRRRAEDSIQATETRALVRFVETAEFSGLTFFATRSQHPLVLEAVLRRRDVPGTLLVELAPRLLEDLQEILLLRQDLIVEQPEILDALEQNPRLSTYSRRRILEYRRHLLRQTALPLQEEEEELEEEASDEEVAQAIEAARRVAPGGEKDEQTGLSDAQVRSMPVQVRMRLARTASRGLRGLLVRDPNPRVAVAVVRYNQLTDSEVELVCHNRSICEDVLEEISKRREWIRKLSVVHALVGNPKTPVAIAVKLVPRLSVRELRDLSRNRNVSDAVRSTAGRLYRIKAK